MQTSSDLGLRWYIHVGGIDLASFPGLRGEEGRPGTHCARMRVIIAKFTREQLACTHNVIINCTRVFEIRKEVSSPVKRRKERRAALRPLCKSSVATNRAVFLFSSCRIYRILR